MSIISRARHRARPGGGRLVRSWVPVAFALLLAVAAGWSIMSLNGRAYRASQERDTVPGMAAGLAQPAKLLVETAKARLAATGPAARKPTPGAPPHMAVYYVQTFSALTSLGRTTGEQRFTTSVSRALENMAATQDGVYAGGQATVLASRRAPAVVTKLNAAFSALRQRLSDRAHTASQLAEGGTMLIMLCAALGLIALLRRFDRMRGRLTQELHVLATHDPLTGLANRRQLSSDLAVALRTASSDRPARLVVFDLDGFKAYNDSFGHHGGDLLLTRLAGALAEATAPQGTSYRLGGDEFCALFPEGADEQVVQRCINALSDAGEAFSIASSHGSVALPTEASDPDLAMQLADERMYTEKNSSRASAGQQTRNLALKVLSVQEPDIEHHSAHVAELAARVGRRLKLTTAAAAELIRAAELHDIGKIAIPYTLLHKAGPLDAQEWEMMRRHPTIGANILASAPALGNVAEIVRHSHERFDGLGYPLGLAGIEIPLASRIVFACDSFDAMTSDRPYSPPMSVEGALYELQRCAGTQFDPDVVEAITADQHATTEDHRSSVNKFSNVS
jgi:diguanylate cyclase (GGDEF)-like protein